MQFSPPQVKSFGVSQREIVEFIVNWESVKKIVLYILVTGDLP